MIKANKNDTVRVHYTGKLADGTVIDSSSDGKPLLFILGREEVIPGFDEAVTGMYQGESKTVQIPCEKAYGTTDANLVEDVPLEMIPDNVDLQVGGQLEVTQEDGNVFHLMVRGLSDTHVTLDANHPLAGEELTFEIELLEVLKDPGKQAN